MPVRDLLARAGVAPGTPLRVTSMEVWGYCRVMEMPAQYADDPQTLLALKLNDEVLSLDHGYPARIIAPNRPGVLQTKWVSKLEVLVRITLGAAGVALIAVGLFFLLPLPGLWGVVVWFGGAIALHDAVVGPIVLLAGLLVARLPDRAVVRGALITMGALVLVTLPVLLRPGPSPNPAVLLALPYGRNLLICLGVTAVVAVALVLVRRRR